MSIIGPTVILRDESREADREDHFRWLNLEEWNYYDEPDRPFQPINREAFNARRDRPVVPTLGTNRWEVDTRAGKHIGWVVTYGLDEQAGSILVGIDLPEAETWGKGYGSQALSLLVAHLFQEMALREVRLDTWTGNARMRGVAEKCGFSETGRSPHRAPFSVRGEPLEFVHYSLSRQAWLSRRGRVK
jgi:RimJ/RimL family protein N-acetyltransferase